MPSSRAVAPPDSPLPAPRGTTGTRWAAGPAQRRSAHLGASRTHHRQRLARRRVERAVLPVAVGDGGVGDDHAVGQVGDQAVDNAHSVDATSHQDGTIQDSTGEACSADKERTSAAGSTQAPRRRHGGRCRLPCRSCRPQRRRWRGSAARSSCPARRRSCCDAAIRSRTARPDSPRYLQRAEQRVGRGVGSGDRDAEPAQDRRQQRERSACRRHPGAKGDRLAGQVHHECQRQHRHHGENRPAQLMQCRSVGLQRPRHRQPQRDRRQHARDQHLGARRGEQVQGEFGERHRLALGADDVEARPVGT